MTTWDTTGLVHNIDAEALAEDITEQPTSELITIYKALTCATNICLKFANIPFVAIPLSELSYAYAVEITNRVLNSGADIKTLDIPPECLPRC